MLRGQHEYRGTPTQSMEYMYLILNKGSMEYMYLIHYQVICFIDFCSVWKNQNRSNIGDSFHQFDLRLLEYYGVLPARE